MATNRTARLGPEVNRILYVKNLPFQITGEELYDLFGCVCLRFNSPFIFAHTHVGCTCRKYGAIRQIRM